MVYNVAAHPSIALYDIGVRKRGFIDALRVADVKPVCAVQAWLHCIRYLSIRCHIPYWIGPSPLWLYRKSLW